MDKYWNIVLHYKNLAEKQSFSLSICLSICLGTLLISSLSFSEASSEGSEETFRIIDQNHDGWVTLDEFTHGFLTFILSEDPSLPENKFFGPLVDLDE